MSNVIITWKYSFYMTLEETVWTYDAVQNGSYVLHIIVQYINKLLVCQEIISAGVYYVKRDYNTELYDLLEHTV